jgi:hypothetical protein
VTFNGGTIHLTCGRTLPPKSFDPAVRESWEKSLRKEDFSFANSLLPGAWTKLAVTLTKANAEDMEYVTIGIDTSLVSLRSSGK